MKLLKENLLAAVILITLTIVDGFFFFPGPIIYPSTTPKPKPKQEKPKHEKPVHSYPKHEYGSPIFIPVPYEHVRYEHKTITTTTPKPKHTYPPPQGGYYAFIPYGYGGHQGYESEETTETETEAPTTTPEPPTEKPYKPEKSKPSYSHHVPIVIPPPFPFLPHIQPHYQRHQPIYSYTPPPGYKNEEIIEEGVEEARGLPNKPPENAIVVAPPSFMIPKTEHSYRPTFESDETPGFMSSSYPDQYRPPGLKRPNGPPKAVNRRPNPPIYTSPPRKQPHPQYETDDKPKKPPPRVYSSPQRKPSRNYSAPPRKQSTPPEVPSFDSNEVFDTPPPRVYSPPPRYGPPRKPSYSSKNPPLQPNQYFAPEPETSSPRNYSPPPRKLEYYSPGPVYTSNPSPETTSQPETTTPPAQFNLTPLKAAANLSPPLELNQPSRIYNVPPPPQQNKPTQPQPNSESSSIYLLPQQAPMLEPNQTLRVYDVPPPSQQFTSVQIPTPKPANSPYNFYLQPQRPPAQNYKLQLSSNPPAVDTTPTNNDVTPMQPPALPAVYETPAHMQVRNMPSYLQPPSLPASYEMPGFTFERMTQANQNYLPPSTDGEHNNLFEMQLANSANVKLYQKNVNNTKVKSNFHESSTIIPSFVTMTMNTKDKVEIIKVPLINDFEVPSEPYGNQLKPTVPINLIPKRSVQISSVSRSTIPPPKLPIKYELPKHKDERKFYTADDIITVTPTLSSTLEPYKMNVFPSRRPAVNESKISSEKNLQAHVINSGIYFPVSPLKSANQDSKTMDEKILAINESTNTESNDNNFPALPVRNDGASKDRWNLRDIISNPLLEASGTPSTSQIELIKQKIERNKNARHKT